MPGELFLLSPRVSSTMLNCSRAFPGAQWLQPPQKKRNLLLDETSSDEPYLLLELVGALGLPSATIDPHCVVRVRGKEIHRTKTIYDDPNPIWTVQTHSLCLIPPGSAAVVIDLCHGSKRLGTVTLDPPKHATGDRLEFPILPTGQPTNFKKAVLHVRLRPAKPSDRRFLGQLPALEIPHESLASDIDFQVVHRPTLFQSKSKFQNKQQLFRVKPFPDPKRKEETEWMSRDAIESECMGPSTHWVSAGHGSIGQIHVEILKADNLPNLDLGAGDVTDPFCALVFEDNMVRTDVIWDDLYPRWMPWSNRAFTFHVRHPTSILWLGLFDYDENLLDNHDPIGRVVINTANFQSHTTYLLKYQLHHDPRQEDARGVLTIRLRIVWADEIEAMRMSFAKPPRCIINVKTDKSFHVLRYLTRGSVDMEKSSMDSVKLYAKELVSYWTKYCYVLDVLLETFLWRGRLRYGSGKSIWFPIQSFMLFLAVVVVIEKPQFMVPILLYAIAWIMLTINYFASRHPYPWKRVKSAEQTNSTVLLGRPMRGKVHIAPNQGVADGKRVDRLDDVKGERMSALIVACMYFMLKVYRVYSKTSVSAKAFATKTSSWSFNILDDRLSYVHMMLKYLCQYTRMFRNLVNWKGYMANDLTINCIVVATVWVIFPVNFIMKWVVRVLAWGLLGPWMKLVDIKCFRPWYMTQDELLEYIDNDKEIPPQVPDFDAMLQSDSIVRMGAMGRTTAEDSLKLRDMRAHIFGKYSEVIPAFDTSRFPAVPLPESTGEDDGGKGKNPSHVYHVHGQGLRGNMVMSRAEDFD